MIQKHVDLIAIALLLSAIAVFSHARKAVVLGLHSSRTVWVTAPHGSPRIMAPAIPRITFSRD